MISIVFERGPETLHDVLVNVFCDGRRGTIAFPKEVWAEIEQRGSVEVFVATETGAAMTPKDASAEARKHLRLLAGELGVSVRGISDDDLDIVAIRFVLDGRITTDALQAIVDDVRDGSGQATEVVRASKEPALPPAPSPARCTTWRPRRRQRRCANVSPPRTAPRTRAPRCTSSRASSEVLPVDKPHPACLVAAREEHGTVCQRCSWLLQRRPVHLVLDGQRR